MGLRHIAQVLFVAFVLAASSAQAQAPEWVDPPGLQRAMEVQDKYTPSLMARDGVVGTSVGYDDNGDVELRTTIGQAVHDVKACTAIDQATDDVEARTAIG